jgi:hypothetical protein
LGVRTSELHFFPTQLGYIYFLMAATCDHLLQRVVAPTVGADDEAVAVHVVVAAIGANR